MAYSEEVRLLATELSWPKDAVGNTIALLDEGNTIPFIARYRKEVTQEMDETMLRQLEERLHYLRNLSKRKEEIIHSITEQGKLTEELQKKIRGAKVLQEVEDLYLPYKQKRKTRASVAEEKGLLPLAEALLADAGNPDLLAQAYLDEEKGVPTIADALAGAQDIIAQIGANDSDFRKFAREKIWQQGFLESKATDPQAVSVYEMYYEYSEPIAKIPPHRILAMNRGEREKMLQVKVIQPEETLLRWLDGRYLKGVQAARSLVQEALADGYMRLSAPALEREMRNQLTEIGETQAITVFGKNLHSLLLQPPIKHQVVLGLDPGLRTGCKLAVVDGLGKVLTTDVIYPHPPQRKYEAALQVLANLVDTYHVAIIAIGNGTASRESEALVAELIERRPAVSYIIVSEAGASVYSASPLAKKEFPDFDVSLRSAISIARRLQDPLAELVKIEPKAVGVGQYQHDIAPKKLDEALGAVVEDCVNGVGVALNTASASLLSYVAGLSNSVADGIITYREAHGPFYKRRELLNVPRLGPKAFEQCAGFLRIAEGDDPLDNTSVHPESYSVAKALLKALGFQVKDLQTQLPAICDQLATISLREMAEQLAVGVPTLKDIIEALAKPGRDPRESLDPPLLRKDVLSMADLRPGMKLMGTVRNVVDFGAFVDIGVKQDGLIHISQFGGKRRIKHPLEVTAIGDILEVTVRSVDEVRGRIGLTLKPFAESEDRL